VISVDGVASRTKVIANPTVLSAMSDQTLNKNFKTHDFDLYKICIYLRLKLMGW
jgi:hypothetical protein